ncbi:MAG: hypothetical protein CM15mP127_13040 [Gammaproteobacteria bacterium]|nr:MAG: hypothetical protein CM15mP127_13040 [Gammaproteobacteria bacterium]
MNIAKSLDIFPPNKGGGIAEWAFGVARELPRLGHKTSVYVTHRKIGICLFIMTKSLYVSRCMEEIGMSFIDFMQLIICGKY